MSIIDHPDNQQLLRIMSYSGQASGSAEYWCRALYDQIADLDRTVRQLDDLRNLGLVEIQENAAEVKDVQWWITEQGCAQIGRPFERPKHLKAESKS